MFKTFHEIEAALLIHTKEYINEYVKSSLLEDCVKVTSYNHSEEKLKHHLKRSGCNPINLTQSKYPVFIIKNPTYEQWFSLSSSSFYILLTSPKSNSILVK
jgi:hypothetical protein